VAEQCYPIKIAHGHVQDLIDKEVDYILLPNAINNETDDQSVESHVCPWGQTLPFVLRQVPRFKSYRQRFMIPTVNFRYGQEFVYKELSQYFKPYGVKPGDCRRAVARAYHQDREFNRKIQKIGREQLDLLQSKGEKGVVLIGRPYNINDSSINLGLAKKLREYYGVNVIPMDFVPMDTRDISDINANMYWNYGRKILGVAKTLRKYPDIHIIYITNFKCGPDSYIKHFTQQASQKPYLTLQFDGHSNDAGMMTRCEAYLDSKGFLRWWKQ
jgi:predicted nucleotide-binding protein (sugar kinase/HSP70/actin superfamily)